MRLEEAAGNLPGVATTSTQLAIVCSNAGRLDEAETWNRRALAVDEQVGSDKDVAIDCNNLAGLLLAVAAQPPAARPAPFQGRDLLAEAEALAERAVSIYEAIGDPSLEVWKMYNILADIADRRGQGEAARAWRRKARASFAAFPGAWARIKQFEPLMLGVVRACGDEQEKRNVSAALQQMAARGGELQQLSVAFSRILQGGRDVDLLADALPYASAFMVEVVLKMLAGEPAPFAQPAAPVAAAPAPTGEPAEEEEEGFTLDQLFGFVAAACRGDAQARQMAPLLVGMLQQPAMPAELQALGGALARILAGERDPGLAANLPGELGQAVIALLGELG